VEAPEALRLLHWPAHTACGEAVAVITGLELTVTPTEAVAEQPAVVVPVTVYVVPDAGQTLTVFPFRFPGIQV